MRSYLTPLYLMYTSSSLVAAEGTLPATITVLKEDSVKDRVFPSLVTGTFSTCVCPFFTAVRTFAASASEAGLPSSSIRSCFTWYKWSGSCICSGSAADRMVIFASRPADSSTFLPSFTTFIS